MLCLKGGPRAAGIPDSIPVLRPMLFRQATPIQQAIPLSPYRVGSKDKPLLGSEVRGYRLASI